MLTLPALKIQQFAGIYGKRARKPKASGVNWGEKRKKRYQRPIIRKKINELAQYYTS